MAATGTVQRIRRLVTEVGLWQTARRIARGLYRRVFPVKIPVHPFDLRYGVDTSGLIVGGRLNSGQPHDRHITAYWGIAPSSFAYALERWNDTLANSAYTCRDYTFFDIGCGKGRGLMLASNLPFRQVKGVELNPALVSIARRNLATWTAKSHACGDIEALQADALEYELPDRPVLLYLFNPFDAEAAQMLLDRVQALSCSRSSPIDILYITPDHADLFARVPAMELLYEGKAPLTAEDTAVDAFQTRHLDFRIYRLLPAARLR